MSDYTENAAKAVIAQIDKGDYSGAKQSLATEYEKLSVDEFKNIVKSMETISKRTPTPDVYMQLTDLGEPSIYINDSYFRDTKIFSPTNSVSKVADETTKLYDRFRQSSQPLNNAKHESLAQDVAKMLQRCGGDENGTQDGDIIWAKRAAQSLLDSALDLPQEEQHRLLERALFLNEEDRRYNEWLPGLNIVFTDQDKDGKRHEISDMKLNFRHRHYEERRYGPGYSGYGESVEVIDLFDK